MYFPQGSTWTASALLAFVVNAEEFHSGADADQGIGPRWWLEHEVVDTDTFYPASVLFRDPGFPKSSNSILGDDSEPLLQSQLKHLALAAYDDLEEKLPGGAGPEVSALVRSWFVTDQKGQFVLNNQGKWQMIDSGVMIDFAPVNPLLFKAVAKAFHTRLDQAGYSGAPLASGQLYPQTDASETVTTAQAKHAFSFDITFDQDGDLIPDYWERRWNLDPLDCSDAEKRLDGRGATALEHYQSHSDPDVTGHPEAERWLIATYIKLEQVDNPDGTYDLYWEAPENVPTVVVEQQQPDSSWVEVARVDASIGHVKGLRSLSGAPNLSGGAFQLNSGANHRLRWPPASERQ